MSVRLELNKNTSADLIVGQRVRLAPPTPHVEEHLDIDVTEYINDSAVSGRHIVIGTETRTKQRIEIGLPIGSSIEFVDDVEPGAES